MTTVLSTEYEASSLNLTVDDDNCDQFTELVSLFFSK